MNGKKAKKLRQMTRDAMKKHGREDKTFGFYYKKAKTLAKVGVLAICAMFIFNLAHADKLGIHTVNPIKFQKLLAENGFKLDLNFIEKTPDSWGILSFDDKGMCVNTYRSLNFDNLNIITEIMWKSMEE